MLRTNYCTFEHQNAIFMIIRTSTEQRDLSFSFKLFASVFQKKVFYYFFLPICANRFRRIFFSPNLFETFHYNTNV